MNVKETIEKRRAYRSLEPVEIDNDLIYDLARVAQIAPSCSNRQPWRFIFIYKDKQLQKLFTTLTPHNKWIEKTSMMIAVFSNPKYDCIIKERKYYLFDTGLATAFIILRATELGFVAHPIAGFNEEKAKEILGIPEEMRLITFINIGKHSTTVNPVLTANMRLGEKQRPPRKDLSEFIYINEFGNQLK
ncbi:MAG: nitroreductase family protein [Candidatus Lokiarchaeota archaeon]